MKTLFLTALTIPLSLLLNACVTDQRLNEVNAKRIESIAFEVSESSQYPITYMGPVGALTQGLATSVPGIGTGLAAGLGDASNKSYASEIDKVAKSNKLLLDQMLLADFKQSISAAGYKVREEAKGGALLRVTAVNQHFHKLIGNPGLISAASFEIYFPASRDAKEEIIWRYRAISNSGNDSPGFSYDELLVPQNLNQVLITASKQMIADAMKYLEQRQEDHAKVIKKASL